MSIGKKFYLLALKAFDTAMT